LEDGERDLIHNRLPVEY